MPWLGEFCTENIYGWYVLEGTLIEGAEMKFYNFLDIKNALTGGILNLFMGWKNNFRIIEGLEVKAFSFLLFFFVVCFAVPSYSCSLENYYKGVVLWAAMKRGNVNMKFAHVIKRLFVTAITNFCLYGRKWLLFGVLISEYTISGTSYNYECCDEKTQHCNSTVNYVYRCFESEHIPPPCVNTCTGNYISAA